MLKEDIKEIQGLTNKVALKKEVAILAIKKALPMLNTYMPLEFHLEFRGYSCILIDNMGINAYEEDCDTPAIIVEWEALTVDELYSLYEKLSYCSYNAITALQNQIATLNKVEEYFKL